MGNDAERGWVSPHTGGVAGQAQTPGDIIVVSDLHAGQGRNPETGRYYALEAFFYDKDFLSFCHYLNGDAKRRGIPFTLVLNGDIFDFIRIQPDSAAPAVSLAERMYGPPNTPEQATRVTRRILRGHPDLVRAFAEVVRAGNRVVVLAGNHDIETQWDPVRAEIRAAVRSVLQETLDEAETEAAMDRLWMRSWFYYEPGRLWVEHGCQYDEENAFRYLLRGKLADVEEAVYASEHDMPLGNFIQRYLFNGFGHMTFVVPGARANLRYLKWFLLNQPRLLARVVVRHLPFAFQVLRRLAKSTDPALRQLKTAHERALTRIAESTGLGEKLHTIDRIVEVRPDIVQATRTLGLQFLRTTAVFGLIALLGLGLWAVGFMAITELRAGFGARALLALALNFLMLAGGAGAITYLMLRDPSRGAPGSRLANAAQRIVDTIHVAVVAFGHTHDEELVRLRRPGAGSAWYFNTGTWIAVFTHDVLLPRERVQYTFLRLRGHEGALLHWSPARGEPLEVVLQDQRGVE